MSLTEFDAVTGAPIDAADAPTDTFAMLDLGAIVPSLTNPRTVFDDGKLAELAESIAASGVHQPILVRPLPASRLDETSRKRGRTPRETHELVSGERRWRASKLAGKATIPAMVRHLTDTQVLEIQIVENLQRADLTELEEAEGYRRLVEQTSLAKEDIGAKIGKSRGYVYARLKLLDLDTAGREALRRGDIDASKALLIARIPDAKLQIKALGQATGSDNYGRALPVKELQTWLQTNVMLSLKRTSFDIKDVTLREGAGACPDCPKRTGANPDLFADVESADLCTDPACYHDKERATQERRFDAAQREGKKVIDQAQADKLQAKGLIHWLRGHYLLDQYPDYNLDLDGLTLRKALGKHCPEPVLVQHPETGEIVEALPRDTVKKIIREHGLSRFDKRAARTDARKAKEQQEQAQLPIDRRTDYAERWQRTAAARADEFLQRAEAVTGSADLLRAWLIDETDDWDNGEAMEEVLGSGNNANMNTAIAALPDGDVPRVLLRYMLHKSAARYDAFEPANAKRQGPRTTLFELLHMAGIDIAAVQAETKRAMESEDRAAEAEAKKAPELAQKLAKTKGAKKSSASPAAQALRAKKTSKEEAQREISAAFQALDAGATQKDQAPGGAGLNEGAAPAAPTAPTFQFGDLARVKADSKGPDGKLRKSIGKVGRVVGIGEDGRVHLKHGERRNQLLVVDPGHLEPYKADPLIGSQVRVLRVGIAPGQDKFLWRHGTVKECRADGWGILLTGKSGAVADFGVFDTDALEVLE